MIRAGSLDRIITVERATDTVADSGAVTSAWAPIAPPMRARLSEITVSDALRSAGNVAERVAIFTIRHVDGITTADRVRYGGAPFDIARMREIGRREGLELICKAAVQ